MLIILVISILATTSYALLVLFSILGFNNAKNSNSPLKPNNHNISVVIAARNEELVIKNCITSILEQEFDDDFEIIVVNDHSDDKTLEVLQNIQAKNFKVYSLPEGKTSKKEALSYGINKASYNLIATTDADCKVPVNWLHNISSNLNEDTDMLLGPIVFNKEKGFLNSFQQLDMLGMQLLGFGMLFYNKPILNNGANLSFKKKSFVNVDGFDNNDTPSGDDIFLLEKFNSQKFRISGILKKSFIVETQAAKSYNEFIQQRLRWASKSKFYKDSFLRLVSIVIFLQNVMLLFIYSQVVLSEKFTNIYVFLLLSKWLIDFILLFLISTFFDRLRSMMYFIPAQLIYPIYILVISFSSMFMKFEWKGRKY